MVTPFEMHDGWWRLCFLLNFYIYPESAIRRLWIISYIDITDGSARNFSKRVQDILIKKSAFLIQKKKIVMPCFYLKKFTKIKLTCAYLNYMWLISKPGGCFVVFLCLSFVFIFIALIDNVFTWYYDDPSF